MPSYPAVCRCDISPAVSFPLETEPRYIKIIEKYTFEFRVGLELVATVGSTTARTALTIHYVMCTFVSNRVRKC